MKHPNTLAGGTTGAFTVLVVYLAGLFGLDVPPEAAAAFTTLVTAAVLFVGRRGPIG